MEDQNKQKASQDILSAEENTNESQNLFLNPPNSEGVGSEIIIHSIETTEQVTARKQIEESKLLMQLALEAGKLGTFDIDLIHHSIIFSERLANILGLDPTRHWTHKNLIDVLHRDDIPLRNKAYEDALHNGSLHYEARIICKDGNVHWIRVHGKVKYENRKAHRIYGVMRDITEEKKKSHELKESEQRIHLLNEHLRYELSATKELGKFSTKFLVEGNVNGIFEALLETAVRLMKSDLASIQIYDPESHELSLHGNKNFHPLSEAFWKKVNATSISSCGEALKHKQRILINDVEENASIKASKDIEYFRLSDIRSVQSTPLISRKGKFIGIISTHWKKVHHPSEKDLQFFDILARQAADLIEQKYANEAIKESEEQFRTLTQSVPQMLCTTDKEGMVDYVNPQWYNYTGGGPGGFLGNNWTQYIHPDDAQNTLTHWRHSLQTGELLSVELRIRAKEGHYKWFIVNAQPIKNNEGEIIKWVGSVTDIHEQKTLAKESFMLQFAEEFSAYSSGEEFFNSLANYLVKKTQLDYAFIGEIKQEKNEPPFIQTLAINAFGKTIDNFAFAILNSPCEQVIQGKEFNYPKDCMRLFSNNETVAQLNVEGYIGYPLFDSKGKKIGIIAAIHQKEITNPEYISAILKVVAKRAEFEMERNRFNTELLQSNKKLLSTIEELNNSKWKLEKKDEFINIASHEMKTPLTTARAYLELLELSLDDPKGAVKTFIKKAGSSINRLNCLIDELLDVSKIQSGKLNYNITEFDFNDMINVTLEDAQYAAPAYKFIKTGKVSRKVTGDKDRIQQVVINLLNNATKYSPSLKEVFINIEEENGQVKVSVKDQGIGIPKQKLAKIFDRYYRVEENEIQFPGMGIGLFISSEIIQRHHGRLWAESEPGKGSTFYFVLPIS